MVDVYGKCREIYHNMDPLGYEQILGRFGIPSSERTFHLPTNHFVWGMLVLGRVDDVYISVWKSYGISVSLLEGISF